MWWSDGLRLPHGLRGLAAEHFPVAVELPPELTHPPRRQPEPPGDVLGPLAQDQLVADLGNWRGRQPSAAEWTTLRACQCPACRDYGVRGLRASKLHGFCCRATHNLWVLLEENAWLKQHVGGGTYRDNYAGRVGNSIYRPIIEELRKR